MLRLIPLLLLLAAWPGPWPAQAQTPAPDRVAFGLDWKAEAEYGGYYQAVATGIYARHGLEVAIRQGGPQTNQAQLLLAGRLDFNLASNSYLALNMAQENLPFIAIAAMFQRDPSVLLAHPGQGNDSFEALRGKPIMIGADTRVGWWNFLRARFGYTDAQIRPYAFSLAPFLAVLLAPADTVLPVLVVVTIAMLAILGAGGAQAGGAPIVPAAIRVVIWGSLAMAITFVAGRLFHATI